MKCFNHNDVDAVAICKNCNKALCMDCLVEFENGISCKGSCEEEVKLINALINRNKSSYKNTGQSYKRNSIIYLLLSIVFLIWGYLNHDKTICYFMYPAGIIFFLGAFFQYSTGKKYSGNDLK